MFGKNYARKRKIDFQALLVTDDDDSECDIEEL